MFAEDLPMGFFVSLGFRKFSGPKPVGLSYIRSSIHWLAALPFALHRSAIRQRIAQPSSQRCSTFRQRRAQPNAERVCMKCWEKSKDVDEKQRKCPENIEEIDENQTKRLG